MRIAILPTSSFREEENGGSMRPTGTFINGVGALGVYGKGGVEIISP